MVFYEKLHNLVSNKTKIICEDYYTRLIDLHKKQLNELKGIITLCASLNITPIVAKGIPLSQLIYDSPYARMCNDIDIIVNEKEMLPLFTSLLEQGFVDEGGFYRDGKLFFPHRWNHHEVIACKKYTYSSTTLCDSQARVDKIYVEIKRGTSAIPNLDTVSSLKNGSTSILIDDIPCEIFNLNNTLLQLLINAYVNSETYLGFLYGNTLRDYLDIKCFLLKFQSNVSWDEIVSLAKSYELSHKIVPVLKNLNDIFSFVECSDIICKLRNSIDYMFELDIPWTITQKTPNEGFLITNWKSNFIERSFFSKDESIIEYLESYKKVYYSNKNPFFCKKIILNEGFSKVHTFRLTDYRNINIGSYTISRRKNFIVFDIFIDYKQCELDFIFRILFLDNEMSSPVLYRYITLKPDFSSIEIQHGFWTELNEKNSNHKKYIDNWQNNPHTLSSNLHNSAYSVTYSEAVEGISHGENRNIFIAVELSYCLNDNLDTTIARNEHVISF